MEKKVILLLSHCLLNQKVRARGLFREGVEKRVFAWLEKMAFPVFQLPCPEFLFLGEREKKTYPEYLKLKGFKDFSLTLAREVKEFVEKTGLYPVIIGIKGSPSCSLSIVKVGEEWKEGKGIFIEALLNILEGEYVEVDYDDLEVSLERIEKVVKNLIKRD